MNSKKNFAAAACILVSVICFRQLAFSQSEVNDLHGKTRIQVALLLDVSNSMDGLIDQAKNQLWNMATLFSRATCAGTSPSIEIALYEYGRTENDSLLGFVAQIMPFTNELDKLFDGLMNLKTHGGLEYCGHVMYTSLTDLPWDTLHASYKAIFIAGNESFLQGSVPYTIACEEAKRKRVIVNTIYCGDRSKGIQEGWDLLDKCGNGSFTTIDQQAKPLFIPSPYDDSIIVLKEKLDETFLVYGKQGLKYYYDMNRFDTAMTMDVNDPNKIISYVVTKASNKFYNYSAWDLVTAAEKNPAILDTVDVETLDEKLRGKDRSEIKAIVLQAQAKKVLIQSAIRDLYLKKEAYTKKEFERLKLENPQTLEAEMEKIIRKQLERSNMRIE